MMSSSLITNMAIRDFFHESVNRAVVNQGKNITPETTFYITNLLTSYTYTDKLFEPNHQGRMVRPLALIYAEALEAESREIKHACLKKLGDVALFITGLFAFSLNRSLVDVDYYIAMGGNAYGYLAHSTKHIFSEKNFSDIYLELAEKFVPMVDILTEVGNMMHQNSDKDILRLYEIWSKSGSELAAKKLRSKGIEPISISAFKH